ncbi:HD domain-containing protein [archaeon]|jgi:dGTPase|nr:HD domain-containing protein [archaeon]MBT4241867.1 HD domain-containing protein [archaeon]MBT4418414.1 HD domain-containing protein [archaeon]
MKAYNQTKGRRYPENYPVKIKNPFLEDFTRIRHSKSYRRLADKTQVISLPRNVYTRTRLTHTGEVVAVSTTISEALGLNTSLCMAIAEGHDIGHVPYGHLGEEIISEILGKSFKHPVGGVVVAQHIEKDKGKGLNLTFETLQGILHHSRTDSVDLVGDPNLPQEYAVVMFADKIAYTFSDLNDAIRYGFLKKDELPKFIRSLGKNQDQKMYNVLQSLIEESKLQGRVGFNNSEIYQDFKKTREFMFKHVYKAIDHSIKKVILNKAYEFLSTEPKFSRVNPEAALLMLTDRQLDVLGRAVNEKGRCTMSDIRGLGLSDSIAILRDKKIDLTNPDLGWGEKRIPVKV